MFYDVVSDQGITGTGTVVTTSQGNPERELTLLVLYIMFWV